MAGRVQRRSLSALIETMGDGVIVRLQFPYPVNLVLERILDDIPDTTVWKWRWTPRATLNGRGQIVLVSTSKPANARTLVRRIAQRFRLRSVIDEMPFPAEPELAAKVRIISAADEQVVRIKLPGSTTPVQEQLAVEMLEALVVPYKYGNRRYAIRTTIYISHGIDHTLEVVGMGEEELERRLLCWAHALDLRYDRLDSTEPFIEQGSIARACNL